MAPNISKAKVGPQTNPQKRLNAAQLDDQYLRELEKKWISEIETTPSEIPPTVCLSRKIGVGALEIADILAQKIGYRVADREIIEQIARNTQLSQKTVKFFDERYPGKMNELISKFFAIESFTLKDYVRQLFSAIFTIAELDPTIFVGRGAHLILPRHRVLTVRLIASKSFRTARLTSILQVGEATAEEKLDQMDKEQQDFFKKVFGKKDAEPNEFDIIINCDQFGNPHKIAEIIRKSFIQKFDLEILENIQNKVVK